MTSPSLQAISCHYASSHCEYIDVEGTSHEKIAEEILEIVERKTGRKTNLKFEVSKTPSSYTPSPILFLSLNPPLILPFFAKREFHILI